MKTVPILQKKVDILNKRVTELSEEFSALALSGKNDFEELLSITKTVGVNLHRISFELNVLGMGKTKDLAFLLYTYIKDLGSSDKTRLLSGFVFFDVKTKVFVFIFREFASFLHDNHFYAYGTSELQIKLRKLGAEPVKYYINKKTGRIRAWRISSANYLKLKEKVNKK